MHKQTSVIKTLNQGKHLHKNQTTFKPTRILRSYTITKSEDALKRETINDKKRKNTSVTDGPSSKVICKSNATTREQVRTSQIGHQYNTARRRKVTIVEQTDKKPGLKSESKRRPAENMKSNILPKAALPTRKNKPYKTKRSSRMLSKSTNKKNVEKNSSPKQKHIKIQTTLTKHDKRKQSSTKDKTVLQNKELHKRKDMLSPSLSRKPSIRVVGKIKTDLNEHVSIICCVDDHTMWIGRQVFRRLMKVKYQETGKLTILKQFQDIDFVDFCFDREYNQALYCNRNNKCVMSISSNFEVKEMKCFQPLCPTCITISSNNFIFVGIAQDYAYDCSEQPNPRQIVKMDRNGTVHQRINSLQDGSPNFLFTLRSTINPVNNELVVIGFKRSNEAYIANFNSEGKNEFLYNGTRLQILFTPRGLVCSSLGNIIVCNGHNGDIHILNKYGQCLHLMNMKATRLPGRPWSLSWGLSGHLLIGTLANPTANILITEYTDHADDD